IDLGWGRTPKVDPSSESDDSVRDVLEQLPDQAALCIGRDGLRGRLEIARPFSAEQDQSIQLLEDCLVQDRRGHQLAQVLELDALLIEDRVHTLVGSGERLAVNVALGRVMEWPAPDA